MISVIITAWKEYKTIGKALNSILNPQKNDFKREFEILIVCPDESTWRVAKRTAEKFKFRRIKWIQDPQKGKPIALNMALKEAGGDILILTDGDVYFGKNVISKLVEYFKDPKVGGVTGRPVALGEKDSFMQFANHFYADVAHHKRMVTMKKDVSGRSLRIVSREPGFFVLSGYISAIRNVVRNIPNDCLADDAFISYKLHNLGYKLAYEPDAKVFVKYAQSLSDWYRQKLRSVGGYEQLWKYGVIKPTTKVRNFWKELEYAVWFPFTYVKNLKEVFWALFLYPTRLWLWIQIFYQQRIKKKSFEETWVRIESTK
ncbi:MAG: glycosyltransferase [Promethearchaeota archaeon]